MDIIVSLTSHGPRLGKLESNFQYIVSQDVPYTKLLVSIDDDVDDLTFSSLKTKFESFDPRVSVVKREHRWRSYAKLLVPYKENPDAVIITCDDDVSYCPGTFSRLYEVWQKNRDCIVCHESNLFPFINGHFNFSYLWVPRLGQRSFDKYLTHSCLFPPRVFGDSMGVFDYDKMMACTGGTNDELWFWVHSTLNRVQSIVLWDSYGYDVDYGPSTDECALTNVNKDAKLCGEYMAKINEMYGDGLLKVAMEIPVVFCINRDNFSGYFYGIEYLISAYGNEKAKVEWGEGIRKSHINAYNRRIRKILDNIKNKQKNKQLQ